MFSFGLVQALIKLKFTKKSIRFDNMSRRSIVEVFTCISCQLATKNEGNENFLYYQGPQILSFVVNEDHFGYA